MEKHGRTLLKRLMSSAIFECPSCSEPFWTGQGRRAHWQLQHKNMQMPEEVKGNLVQAELLLNAAKMARKCHVCGQKLDAEQQRKCELCGLECHSKCLPLVVCSPCRQLEKNLRSLTANVMLNVRFVSHDPSRAFFIFGNALFHRGFFLQVRRSRILQGSTFEGIEMAVLPELRKYRHTE
jgi:hypothetical protein